jgi:hypothetical protein
MALDGDAPDHVALQAIRDALDRAGLSAKTEVTVELKPWEHLMQDITGIARISRAEHLANQGRAIIEVEAELIDGPDSPVDRPDSPKDAMRDDEAGDDPNDDSASPSGPPSRQLMTQEDAMNSNQSYRTWRRI